MDEPPFSGFLMSLNHSLPINGADEAVGLICVCIAPVRYSRGRSQVIGRPASQDHETTTSVFS